MGTLGKKIRLLRHQKGWSQKDAATQLDISIPAFSKIEAGITDINLSRIIQISKLFNVSVLQLLSSSDTEEIKDYVNEIDAIKQKLQERDDEIIELQKKVIDLYEPRVCCSFLCPG
ncbi:helix-turn-helix transcriptional regulator [Sphingobacterium sp. DR205]|uniref:helix-turn-helix domain-containing protein n=1 Tax=Sphingobacterium sp. DR205 TaxID=2713573 RepID=UPI0013E4B019|nr:helix-turn-helix transcriptional regulator [Sphingobacterium sp. DR205]QIH34413.1 helix-turn-helix domain-containing protein [Sphingobacterium sp. DR205]